MNFFKVIIVAILFGLIWLFGCGGPDWSLVDLSRPIAPRPSHFGFILPYPVSAPPFDINNRTYRAIAPKEAERLVPIVLEIDTAGQVCGMTPVSPNDSVYAERYGPFLVRYHFEPGLVGGVVSPMSLLVDLQIGSVTAEPIVRFPVDPNQTVRYYNLYWRAMGVLGIDIPTLTRKFSNQIKSAIHWGKYTPLRIDGRAVESSSLLIVSLYPMVKYPSAPIDPNAVAELKPWDRARVRLLPDTIGLVMPPVPKREWSGEILDSFHQGMTPELVSCRIAIDTAGKNRLSAVSTDFHRARNILNARAHDILFFPAMGLDGSPRPFEDLIYLRYLNEANVRIWFNWLGGSDPGPPAQVPEPQ
ncbi:MAG: hypothetical protein JRJ87_27195 [Deltaproteobacteria bacterium]|nr:hypothetical protein [Deltaproteobacteria bacterium]